MLVISRRVGESFFIGDDVKVVVLKCGVSVRLGIEAPNSVSILRGELFDEKHGTSESSDGADVQRNAP